jgi:hypothetical protein
MADSMANEGREADGRPSIPRMGILGASAWILVVQTWVARPASGAVAEKPNIILCMADDQRWGMWAITGIRFSTPPISTRWPQPWKNGSDPFSGASMEKITGDPPSGRAS